MKKLNISIILNVVFFIFLLATFYFQYEQLFVTRITLIVFALVHLFFEIKKDYILRNKTIFIIFSAISFISVIITVIVDNSSVNVSINNRDYLIPIFTFILIAIMYKDLYTENQ